MATDVAAFEYTFVVPYSDCDMQRVVHNSVYLRWCDDLADRWFRSLGAELEEGDYDVMVKRADVVWAAPCTRGDEVTIALGVTRWGTTSFDVGYTGSCEGEPRFEATMTYVGVRTGTVETTPVPDWFRAAAG